MAIRQDWKESLPAVLAGEDDKFYPMGWAKAQAGPRTVKTSFHYMCFSMKIDPRDILSMRRTARMCWKRDAIGLALWRRHQTSLGNLARVLHRDWSSMKSLLRRAKEREKRETDFADFVRDLEALV